MLLISRATRFVRRGTFVAWMFLVMLSVLIAIAALREDQRTESAQWIRHEQLLNEQRCSAQHYHIINNIIVTV